MTNKEIRSWYDSLPDDERMSFQRSFDIVYDNLGSRETKFFRWLKIVKPKRKYTKN